METTTLTQVNPTDLVQHLRLLLTEVTRLTHRLLEVGRAIRGIVVDTRAQPASDTKPESDRRRVPKGNYAKVRQYLKSLKGGSASIPVIAKATGVPQSSLRTLIYKTKREWFESVVPFGSNENQWKLIDSMPDLFGDGEQPDDGDDLWK